MTKVIVILPSLHFLHLPTSYNAALSCNKSGRLPVHI